MLKEYYECVKRAKENPFGVDAILINIVALGLSHYTVYYGKDMFEYAVLDKLKYSDEYDQYWRNNGKFIKEYSKNYEKLINACLEIRKTGINPLIHGGRNSIGDALHGACGIRKRMFPKLPELIVTAEDHPELKDILWYYILPENLSNEKVHLLATVIATAHYLEHTSVMY